MGTATRIESRVSKMCFRTHAQSIMIHSSQKVEAMNIHSVVHPHTRTLLSHEKEGHPDMCHNTDELRGRDAQGHQPDTEEQTLCNYIRSVGSSDT